MAARREDLADQPYWPRLLSTKQAAAYLGLTTNTFKNHVGNELPESLRLGGRKLWDRKQLDEAVDRLTGGSSLSTEKWLVRLFDEVQDKRPKCANHP